MSIMSYTFGELEIFLASDRLDLVAEPTSAAIRSSKDPAAFDVCEIDPSLADTAAFCEHYKISPGESANCVIVKATRADKTWFAACVVLATTKADVNSLVRKHLDARKVSFAPMEEAVALTKMEYGGITPVGLPSDWPILIDKAVAQSPRVIIGSGLRKSKIAVSGKALAGLANVTVLESLGVPRG